MSTLLRRAPVASPLYDVPGPRTRRIFVVVSVAVVAVLAGLAYLAVVRPLAARGQFSAARWAPLIDPSNEVFGQLWTRLGYGVRGTLTAAAFAIVSSLICGTSLALLRLHLRDLRRRSFAGVPAAAALPLRAVAWLLNALTRFCVEVLRGLPLVITIFFVGRGLPEYGVGVEDPLWYLVIGLTLYNMVVIAEMLRSGVEGLPVGQREAAEAVGLSPAQANRMILLPQAFRVMLPALISQLVVVLKDTSLGFIVSYEELLNVTKQATQVLNNPIQLYLVVGVIYIVVNYALSKLAGYAQRRLTRARAAAVRSRPDGPA